MVREVVGRASPRGVWDGHPIKQEGEGQSDETLAKSRADSGAVRE